MGGSKTKTTSNQQQSQTVELPAWMTQAGQDLYGKAAAAAEANPTQAYTGQMRAGASANQTMASAAAAAGLGAGQSDLDAARMMTARAAGTPQQMVQAPKQGVSGVQAAQQGQTGQVKAGNVQAGEFDAAAAAKYASPYTQQVQQNTLTEMRRQAGIDREGLNDSVQAAGAFGGTRGALLEAEQARNQSTERAQYLDRSNAEAYEASKAAFDSDRAASMTAAIGNADRSLAAGTTNATLWDQMLARDTAARNDASKFNATASNTAAGANADRSLAASTTNAGNQQSMLDRMIAAAGARAGIGTSASDLTTQQVANLANTGMVDQATTDDQLQSAYQEFLRMQSAPNEQYQNLMAILSGTPRNVTTNGTSSGTATTKTSPGFMNTMMGLGQLGLSAAGTFSDRRLKRDIERIDELANGLGVYRYGYVWDGPDEPPRIGVMADEVARIVPHALGPSVAGFATVDYSQLGGLF